MKKQIAQLAKRVTTTSRVDSLAMLRSEGDALRDNGEFAEAARAYEVYLEKVPDDFAIWVQRGNCLKDSGSFSPARACYETAIRLNARDADVHLQLGHLLKLYGHQYDAVSAYRKAYDLDPTSSQALSELRRMGVTIKGAKSPLEASHLSGIPVKILDISDILVFLRHHNRVTGIQRVQACIALACMERLDTGLRPDESILFSYCDQAKSEFFSVDNGDFSALLEMVIYQDPTHAEVRQAVERVHNSMVPITPRMDDIYVLLGAFWIGPDYANALTLLKDAGVHLGVYIYDLIPITHPQYVDGGLREEFFAKVGDIMNLVDFVLAISDHVAGQVVEFMRVEFNRTVPVIAVPLAHELPISREAQTVRSDFIDTLPKEFVLCVCTIEGRKNHALLLKVWSALARKYGADIPHLLLVGRWGWCVEEFRRDLEQQRYVDGKITVIGNVSDAELTHLYDRCLFTVFPSFAEGWGLPVGESLARGKPCIASNATSIPEVGGTFCRYFDPSDASSAISAIDDALQDRDGLKKWTDHIARDFQVRTWAEVAQDFLTKTAAAVAPIRGAQRKPIVELKAARIYRFTRHALFGDRTWARRAVRFALTVGWHAVEEWGAWASRRLAKLEFGTALPNTDVRLLLELRLPPPTDRGFITLSGGDAGCDVPFSDGRSKWVEFTLRTDGQGVARLQIERRGEVAQIEDARNLYFGISALAFHPKNDLAARVELLESMHLFPDQLP